MMNVIFIIRHRLINDFPLHLHHGFGGDAVLLAGAGN
jgi:hypothetical protein